MPQVRPPSDFQVNDTVDGHVSVAAGGEAVSLRGDRHRVVVYIDELHYYTKLTDVKFQFF